MAEEIRALLKCAEVKNIKIDFCWVPGHGIKGNDGAAKEASTNEDIQFL